MSFADVIGFFTHKRPSVRPSRSANDLAREKELEAERAAEAELSKLRSTRLKFDTRPKAEKTGKDLLDEVDGNDTTMREAFGNGQG